VARAREQSGREGEAMSEQEKLNAQLVEAQRKATELEAARQKDLQEFNTERVRSAVKLAALSMGFADPDDATTLADLSKVAIDGEKISGIKEALEALAKAKPYLINGGGQKPGGPAPRPPAKNRSAGAIVGSTPDRRRSPSSA